ncbi:MAG: hypothetical protein ACK5Y2_08095 [Bdellovibrionales bacterium]
MKTAFLLMILLYVFANSSSQPKPEPTPQAGRKAQTALGQRLRSEIPCIFQAILESKGKSVRPELPLPEVLLDEEVELAQYQDDVEPQWNFRPEAVGNVYVAHKNRIYLYAYALDWS